MINLIDEIKKVGYGLLFIIISITVFTYFNFDLYNRMLYLIIFNGLFLLIVGLKDSKLFDYYKFAVNSGQIIIFLYLLNLIGKMGSMGYIGSILLVCFLILYKKWSQYIKVKQHIESMIWGKPLNEYVKEGKRPPKIEIKK